MIRVGRAEFSSFTLTEDEVAGLAPGDYLMLPEIGSVPPKWQTEVPKDERVRVCAPETAELTFAEFADDSLPEIPMPTELTIMRRGAPIANGRLEELAGHFAVAIEEVL